MRALRIQFRQYLTALFVLFFSIPHLHAANLALNRTVHTSSNYNASHAGAKAVDGVTSAASKWTSNGSSASSWMYVDLGSNQSIAKVVVKHAGAAGEWTSYNTSAFAISVWNGTGWTQKANVSNNTASITTHNFSANARYVLLHIFDAGIDNHARIPEFEVHGSSGGCAITLNSSGTSSIGWPYANSQFTSRTCGSISAGCGTNNWNVTCSSACGYHIDDDYYADDWIRFNGQGGNISCGENFYAPLAGTVLYAGRLGYSYGRTVIIRSSDNNSFAFRVAHLQSIAAGITQNATVSVGQLLGVVGNDDGTDNGEGSNFVCHTHCVLYKNINNSTALSYLGGGHAPSGAISQSAATTYAAPYYLDAVCSNKQGDAVAPDVLASAIPNLSTELLQDLEIFPNPMQGTATLRWVQQDPATVNIQLVNLLGQTVKAFAAGNTFQAGSHQLHIETGQVDAGMYFLVMETEGTRLTQKVTLLGHE